MPDSRHIKGVLQRYIERQQSHLALVQIEQAATVRFLLIAHENLKNYILKLYPDISKETFEALKSISEHAGAPRDFEALWQDMESKCKEADQKLADYIQENGTIQANEEAQEKLKTEIEKLTSNIIQGADSCEQIEQRLSAYNAFNAKAKIKISDETLSYYEEFSFGRFLNLSWHQGRRIIKEPVRNGMPYVLNDVKELANLNKDIPAAEDLRKSYEYDFSRSQQHIRHILELSQETLSEHRMSETFYGEVLKCFQSEDFLAAFREKHSDDINTPIEKAVFQIKNFTLIRNNIGQLIDQMKRVLTRLEESRENIHPGITPEFKKIDDVLESQGEAAKYMRENAPSARSAILSSTGENLVYDFNGQMSRLTLKIFEQSSTDIVSSAEGNLSDTFIEAQNPATHAQIVSSALHQITGRNRAP